MADSIFLLESQNQAGTFYIYEKGVGRNTTGDVLAISPTVGITIGNTGQTLTTPLSILGTTTTGFSIGSTATDGLAITGVCTDAIHISGSNTATAIHISGDQVDNILIDVDAAADNGLKIAVDDGITLGVGINLDRTGTTGIITTAISIDTDGTTAIDIAAGFTGVTGIQIAGTASGDGILISGACADAIHISGTNTATGLHISGDQVDAILIDGDAAASNAIKVLVDDGITIGVGLNLDRTGTTGVITTGISIDTDGTTAIDIAAGFTGVTGLQIAGTASGDGILISGACADAIHISGTNTATGLHISGDQVDFILLDVDAAADNGLKIAVDDGITLTAGIALTRTGTTGIATTGISIDTDGTTAISIGTGFTGTTGIAIAGTSTNAISITGSATTALNVGTGTFGTGIALAGTLTTGMTIAACTTGISVTGATTNAISITGNATTAITVLTGTFGTGLSLAGTLTTGITIGTCATGINLAGQMTSGISGANATFSPDASRTNSIFNFGTRATEKSVDIAGTPGTAYHFDPIQMNLNVTCSVAPNTTSTWNGIYQNITHDTTDMTSLRLKCADWNIVIGKDVLDAYVYQGELDFTANADVGGEAAALGLTVNASAGTVTGNIWGEIIVMDGASMPSATSAALFLSARTNITHAIYIEPTAGDTITNGIYVNFAGTITNFINFGAPTNSTYFLLASATGGCVNATASVGAIAGRLIMRVGAVEYAIPYYALT